MKCTLSIGVGQHHLTELDLDYEKNLTKRLRSAGYTTRRCDIDANIVMALWHFEAPLANHDYIPSRVDALLGLTKFEWTVIYFQLDVECRLGDLGSRYKICDEDVPVVLFNGWSRMFLMRHLVALPIRPVANGFQKMCEWFTTQAALCKTLEQGHKALTEHHRLADTRSKIEEAQKLCLLNLQYPPAI